MDSDEVICGCRAYAIADPLNLPIICNLPKNHKGHCLFTKDEATYPVGVQCPNILFDKEGKSECFKARGHEGNCRYELVSKHGLGSIEECKNKFNETLDSFPVTPTGLVLETIYVAGQRFDIQQTASSSTVGQPRAQVVASSRSRTSRGSPSTSAHGIPGPTGYGSCALRS